MGSGGVAVLVLFGVGLLGCWVLIWVPTDLDTELPVGLTVGLTMAWNQG